LTLIDPKRPVAILGKIHPFFGVGIPLAVAAVVVLVGCKQSQSPAVIKIAAVGDTNGYSIFEDGIRDDPLKEVHSVLNAQDVFIENFEGVILSLPPLPETCPKQARQSAFYSPPHIADFLHPARYAVATLANNHILDCGIWGIRETVAQLGRRGILAVGAGENSKQACEPLRIEVNGVRLAILAYLAIDGETLRAGSDGAGAASWTRCGGNAQIAELAASGSVVLVALHLHQGPGWTEQPFPPDLDLVRRALQAGADLVIAHGPHVPQGILESNGGVALLSLGDFLMRPDYEVPEKAKRSMIAEVVISKKTIEVRIVPIRLDHWGHPIVPMPWDASWILSEVAELSEHLGTKVTVGDGIGRVTVQRRH